MALDQKDLELIERIIYKNSDDIAISISRSFERLEEGLTPPSPASAAGLRS